MFNSFPPPDGQAKTDIWFNPEFDPADMARAQHIVVEGCPDPLNPFDEPQFETTIATEDDFEDDCPLCEMMRERVRSGEEIEIMKVKWE